MNYNLHTPCKECPFLTKMAHGFTIKRLLSLAGEGAFHCHKTGTQDEESGDFIATDKSSHCAGMLIFFELQERPNQLMRIAERLGLYDRSKLNMKAPVRRVRGRSNA